MKNIKKIVTPLALAMVLTGCMSLAPKYERPAAPVAAGFPVAPTPDGAAPVSAATNEAASSIAWQRFFADQRLQQLIALALENNRDLRVAVLNIEQARATYRIRRADLLPTVGVGATGQVQPGADAYQAGVQISSFELDFFGRVRSLSNAAQAQFFATEEARKTTQISLIAQVAVTYLAYQADEELLALTRQTLKTREDSQGLTQLKYDNGIVSKLDLDQSLSLVEQARVVLAQQLRQRAQDANALTLLVGGPIPDTLPQGVPLAETRLAELPPGLPSDLLAVRPDVRSAEQQLIAANANIGAARANFFPNISLTGSGGSASTELNGLFKGGSFGFTFAPRIFLPIFDYGRNKANLDSAKAGREIAVAQYEKSIQTAFREVADALAGQSTYTEQLRAQTAVARSESDRFGLSDLRYRNGAASYLDLLDAQRSLFDAQRASVEANLLRLQNQVTLYRVLGGGWTVPATATTAANAATTTNPSRQ
ncbi:efflux transporter outer membrane subunit [Massilia sp. S19_KUP03_FR1]|uniref:efflux transporter outer membrane subunit n=1 Tax=Massilia sp. S19_KUP03_FR1 TaxID=3025503 RepID=UPI002FCD1492